MKHGVVEDAVDGDRGANPERERENCCEGKAGIAENLPECETEILKQCLHTHLLTRSKRKYETAA
jgi:hypothetical protein